MKIVTSLSITMTTFNAYVTDRDLRLLQTLFECRVATTLHLATLHFEGRFEAAKKRVQKLKAAGILAERPRRVSEPAVMTLTNKAFRILADNGLLNQYPALARQDIGKRARVSDLTIRHELAVMDIRCAFTAALARQERQKLIDFSTWPLLHSFTARPAPSAPSVLVRPDGYLRITENGDGGEQFESDFFVEVDRSSETQETLVMRSLCYRAFYLAGGLATWHDRPKQEFKDFPFRTLIVVSTEERRNNLALRLLQPVPPILSQVWIGIYSDVVEDPFGAVWTTPADYRTAVANTPYDAMIAPENKIYRRRPDREAHVAATLRMRSILTR